MISLDILAFFILIFIIFLDVYKNRKNIKFKKGIIFRYFKEFTSKTKNFVIKREKYFSFLGFLSFLISLPSIIIISFLLLFSLIKFQPTVTFVLPSISGYSYPGPIISVPFFYWIISIFLIVFFHETLHAIVAIKEKVNIKNYGLIYFLILPIGAFVDINEKQLKRRSIISKIKIYAAGSLGNFILSLLTFLIIFAISEILFLLTEAKGVYFEETIPNSPAHEVNLSGIIIKMDNQTITTIYDLQKFLSDKKPGDIIKIYTTSGNYTLKLSEKDNKTFIGINSTKTYLVFKLNGEKVSEEVMITFFTIFQLLKWIFFLSLGIGLANMLPIIPLDGGLIIKEILTKFLGNKRGEKASRIISTFFFILIVFSLILSLKSPIVAS
ncbi:MAG: M50 family metallopeptidase [Candidatus Aenigmatarchaeota archaeon]